MEDSTSGFTFVSDIVSELLRSIDIDVYTSQGYGALDTKFEELIKENKISDKLLVCFDRLVVNPNYQRRNTEKDIVTLYKKVEKIENRCKELNISFMKNEWVCFEEMFMCGNFLLKLLKAKDSQLETLFKFVGQHPDFSDRAKIYRKEMCGNSNIEASIGRIMKDLTSSSRNWAINKEAKYTKLGKCWFVKSNRCTENFNINDCSNCKIKQTVPKDMWAALYQTNYILSDLLDKLIELNTL